MMNDPLLKRLLAHWPRKFVLGVALTLVFCVGYFSIQYHPLRPALSLPLTVIDRAVAFAPRWAWVYQSVYLLLLFAWLCETKEQLRRYGWGFVVVMFVGFICFALWPVAGPRPLATTDDALYRMLIRYDTSLNSFPSLHVALATYSACVALAVTDDVLHRRLRVLLPLWVVLIGYATLATKQHYFIDLPPGVVLGWLAQRMAWATSQHKQSPAGALCR